MKKGLLFLGLCMILCGVIVPNVKVSAQELEEHTAHITDPEFAGVLQEMVENTYSTMSTAYTIDWKVSASSIKATGYFKRKAGSQVAVGIKLSGNGYVGIMSMDGVIRYVEGTTVSHAFKITEYNYYCFIVQNKTKSKITAKGHYALSS